MIKLGLIGFGHWGPNLFRNFLANPSFEVVAVVEREPARLEAARLSVDQNLKTIHFTPFVEDILDDLNIDAVAIATPASTHFALASACIQRGKHVLVEKPLCTRSEEGRELIRAAELADVTLMVDHTILFTGAVQKIREICNTGELGRLCYLDAVRANLGLFQKDVNVLWDLAPHDFSVVDFLFKEELLEIEASGYAHLNENFPDIAYLNLHFASNKIAHFNLSWMSPIKTRHMIIGGTHKMLVWDDNSETEKVKLYDSGITYPPLHNGEVVLPQYRRGGVFCPKLSSTEALANVVTHFADVIMKKQSSSMDGHRGLRVVQMLEKAQRALDKSLAKVHLLREGEMRAIPELS